MKQTTILSVLREFIADVKAAGVAGVRRDWPDLARTYTRAKHVNPPEGSTVLVLDSRELAHLLVGIRLMQAGPGDLCAYADLVETLVDEQDLDEMTEDELDALAERLNTE